MTNRHRTKHNWDTDRSIVVTTVHAVATVAGKSPEELPPLTTALDPDSLNSLFQPHSRGTVQFTYAGYNVTVRANGEIFVEKPRGD